MGRHLPSLRIVHWLWEKVKRALFKYKVSVNTVFLQAQETECCVILPVASYAKASEPGWSILPFPIFSIFFFCFVFGFLGRQRHSESNIFAAGKMVPGA